MIDLRKLLEAGYAQKRQLHAEKEAAVRGHPRVGSSGCVENGEVYGTCHRVVLARSLGLEKEPELDTQIMWLAGETNELGWEEILGLSGFDGTITHQYYVKHKIDGVPLEVLGHPDIVLERDGKPVMGIELKGIFGNSTAISTKYDLRPKTDNLIQTAAYSYMLDVPYALAYTNPSWISNQYWAQKKYGEKHMLPFYSIFYLKWIDDRVYYWHESQDESDAVRTVITKEGIQDFYRLVEEMKHEKDLGPRLNAAYPDGTENRWGKEAGCAFCNFKTACDKTADYDEWIDEITLICGGSNG